MLTIDALRTWGANVNEGLERCMNMVAFYLRLVPKAVEDANFEKLPEAVAAGDMEKAFEAAHALKGSLANMALTPILNPVQVITELLRNKAAADYGPLLSEIAAARESLIALMNTP